MSSKDDFESKLAFKFSPTYISSANENCYLVELEPQHIPRISLGYPPWKPCIYYSIFKHNPKRKLVSYEINYLSIWDRDTGGPINFAPHLWDTERIAVLVTGPSKDLNPSNFKAEKIFYTRHGLFNDNIPAKWPDIGPTVYWSLGKHASYPTYPSSFEGLVKCDVIIQPEERAERQSYTLRNAGTCENPNDYAPWIAYKEKWGPDKVDSIYWKLKNPIWKMDRESEDWIPIQSPVITDASHVKLIQSASNLSQTGVVDENFVNMTYNISPEILRYAPSMDENLFYDLMRRKPTNLDQYTASIMLEQEIPFQSVINPKKVEGKVSGMNNINALNLGQIGAATMIYGLVDPKEGKIFDVVSAPIDTIRDNAISSSRLRKLSNYDFD